MLLIAIHNMKDALTSKRRLIIIISVLLVFSFTITSILSYNVTRDAIILSSKTETLPLISDNIYSEIQQVLFKPINNSSLMANDEFLIDWVLAGEKDPEVVVKYLQRIKEEYQYFTAFYVSENSQNYYYYDGILKKISPEDPHDVWYYDFRAMNTPYLLDVDTDEATDGTVTIFINHRLEDNAGNFLGVTGVGLKMEAIGKTLKAYEEKYHHLIFMIDSDGLIQVHPDETLIEKMNIGEMEGISSHKDAILAARSGTNIYEYKDNDRDIIISARFFPSLGWYLIVEQDQKASMKGAFDNLIRNITIGFVVTGLVILLVVLMVNGFHSRIEALASQDELTGLSSRRKMQDIFTKEVAYARRYQQPLSVLMIDIDHFKDINDEYGHQIGDEYLKQLSAILASGVREIDSVGRWGGEEFIVLLHKTDKSQAFQTAERLRKLITSIEINHFKGKVESTVSIGMATANGGELDINEMISIADEALYIAKAKGRNQVCSDTSL